MRRRSHSCQGNGTTSQGRLPIIPLGCLRGRPLVAFLLATLGFEFCQTSMHRMGFPPQIIMFKRPLCGQSTLLNIQKMGISKHKQDNNRRSPFIFYEHFLSVQLFIPEQPITWQGFLYFLQTPAIRLKISILKLDSGSSAAPQIEYRVTNIQQLLI